MKQHILFIITVLCNIGHLSATTSVLSHGCVNVVTDCGADPTGATDSTAAFKKAIPRNPSISSNRIAVYVPSGTYKLSAGFNVARGHFFGEPSAPPTIHLVSNSGLSGAFFYFNNPDRSTNNGFVFALHDINFVVDAGNAGCTDAVAWAVAQDSSVRNVTVTRLDGNGTCFHQTGKNDGGGGGGSISDLNCSGGRNALVVDQTSQIPYRHCVFHGPVHWGGYWVISFINCTFDNPGGSGLTAGGGDYLELINCTFTSGTPFSPSSGLNYRLEHTLGQTQSSGNVYLDGNQVSGSSANLLTPPPFIDRRLPAPDSSCIDVTAYGVTPNTGSDQGPKINALLAAGHNQLFFPGAYPVNNYTINTTVNLGPGQGIWGDITSAENFGTGLIGTANPILNVTGNGSGGGVNIVRMGIRNDGQHTCIVWNGDPASNLFDVDFASINAGATPFLLVQSGGFFMDGSEPALLNFQNSNTWMQYNASGPAYIIGVNPEHLGGPTMVIANARNLQMRSWEMEYSSNSTSVPLPITNSSGIVLSGCLRGNIAPPYFLKIDNKSTVVVLGTDSVIHAGTATITYNGSGYGPGLGLLRGFFTDQGVAGPTPTPVPPPAKVPYFVQGNMTIGGTGGGTVSTLNLTYSNLETSRDNNVISISFHNVTATITSVTDSKGNIYTVASPLMRSSSDSQAIYWCQSVASGSNTVTVKFSSPVSYATLRLSEYYGLSAIDKHSEGTGSGATASVPNSTTSNANDMIIVACNTNGVVSGASPGFVERMNGKPYGSNVSDKATTASGSFTAFTPLSGSTAWVENLVAFSPSH